MGINVNCTACHCVVLNSVHNVSYRAYETIPIVSNVFYAQL
jgi:ferredoxin